MERPPRHLIWLGAAVCMPCLALVALTFRILEQETQLQARRAQQAEERQVDEARRHLLAALESYQTGQKQSSFRGLVRNGKVVLPWDQPAPYPQERALLEHAVKSKGRGEFRPLARLAPAITDDLAIPVALYAIPHLDPEERKHTLQTVGQTMIADPRHYSPAALYLLRSLLLENHLDGLAAASESKAGGQGMAADRAMPGTPGQQGGASVLRAADQRVCGSNPGGDGSAGAHRGD